MAHSLRFCALATKLKPLSALISTYHLSLPLKLHQYQPMVTISLISDKNSPCESLINIESMRIFYHCHPIHSHQKNHWMPEKMAKNVENHR